MCLCLCVHLKYTGIWILHYNGLISHIIGMNIIYIYICDTMNENQIDEYTKCHAAYLVFILNMSYVNVCLYYTHVYIYI